MLIMCAFLKGQQNMSDYQIIRVKKHSSMASITSAGRHTFREEPTPNADMAKTGDNVIHGASNTADLIEGVKRRVGVCDAISKVKPVLAIEYMITASPDAFERHGGKLTDNSDYFKKSMEWLEKKHGAQNIISSTLHLDEKTPHLAVFVVPVVNEKAKTIKRSVNQVGGGRVRREETLRKRRTTVDELDATPSDRADVEDQVWSGLRRERVREALATLPQAQRHALELAYFGGHTQREIAGLTDTPLGTVKTRMLSGMRKLRDSLESISDTAVARETDCSGQSGRTATNPPFPRTAS